MKNWLVISTHLKNISQIGNLPPNGWENKKYLKPPTRKRCAKCTQNGDLDKPPACPIEKEALVPKGRVDIDPSPTHELYSRGVHRSIVLRDQAFKPTSSFKKWRWWKKIWKGHCLEWLEKIWNIMFFHRFCWVSHTFWTPKWRFGWFSCSFRVDFQAFQRHRKPQIIFSSTKRAPTSYKEGNNSIYWGHDASYPFISGHVDARVFNSISNICPSPLDKSSFQKNIIFV